MKKLLAIVLCLALCMGVLAITASAETTYSVAGAYVAPGATEETAGIFKTAWTPGATANVMIGTGTNTYSITYKDAPAGTYKFKVTDGTWTNCWGDGGNNYVVTLNETCDLTINFDSSSKAVSHEAVGASVAEPIKVHAKVPSTWTNVNAYAWNDAGNNKTWPGAAMTLGSDGWYTIEIPAWAENIIINNGSAQTQDMVLPDADEVWIVVEGSIGTIYTSNPDAGAEPAPEPAVTIDTVGIRGDSSKLAAVNWDNDVAMTKTGEEGYGVWEYTFKNVPAQTWPTIKFTVNGGWDLNFGCEDDTVGATSGTAHNAVYNGSNLWFEVKEESDVHVKLDLSNYDATAKTGATYTITIEAVVTEEPNPTPDPVPTGMIIVHAQVPEDWTAANAYVWDANNAWDVAWPGAAMEKGDDGWYTLAVPSNSAFIIINDGKAEGALQTQDIELTGADEIWIVVTASENGGYIGTLAEAAPTTADGANLIAVCAAMLLAGAAVAVTVAGKKRFF